MLRDVFIAYLHGKVFDNDLIIANHPEMIVLKMGEVGKVKLN